MKIDQPLKWSPPLKGRANLVIPEPLAVAVDPEPLPEVLGRRDVIAGKNIQPAQAPQQNVVRASAPDAFELHEPSHHRLIVRARKIFESVGLIGNYAG